MPAPDEGLRDDKESDDGIPAACWLCGRSLAADEPHRLVPGAPADA